MNFSIRVEIRGFQNLNRNSRVSESHRKIDAILICGSNNLVMKTLNLSIDVCNAVLITTFPPLDISAMGFNSVNLFRCTHHSYNASLTADIVKVVHSTQQWRKCLIHTLSHVHQLDYKKHKKLILRNTINIIRRTIKWRKCTIDSTGEW